ncbi:MAG TPA: GTP-binding protein, partial [Acidobacteriota bacterium]|nr:GTP-binding protein [Acidobacteriota bacterium]HNC43874.1 GTP-binding protein [Acidobacteriota bacterium]
SSFFILHSSFFILHSSFKMSGPAVNIVTGFLGSGKTTLLQHVLKHGLNGRRVALIINEMADLGIDGQIVECANVERMIELNNGCICCTINREFASAIQSIIETANPHLIIIETTGAAEVMPLIDEVYTCGLRVDAVITVVDALNFFQAAETSDVTLEQVAGADFLVLNKLDLVTARPLGKVRRALRKLNPRALILETVRGALESDVLFATSAASFREHLRQSPSPAQSAIVATTDTPPVLERYLAAATGNQPSSRGNSRSLPVAVSNHLQESDLSAFSYTSSKPLKRLAFEQFLEGLPPAIYRAKGIVHFDGERWPCLFNFTCGRYDLDPLLYPVTATFQNQAIFIGHTISTVRHQILPRLQACEQNSPNHE